MSLRRQARYLRDFNIQPIFLVSIIVFFMPVGFLVVKSWVTTSLFLIFFICFFPIVFKSRHFFANRSQQFWILLACLLTPFLSELFAQLGRGEIVSSSLDGPARMILSAVAFIYLSRSDITKIIDYLSIGSALGIIGVLLSLIIFPEDYWGVRAATYFVDPITLPCYTVGLLGLVLFSRDVFLSKHFSLILRATLTIVSIYIAIESQSRSSWVALCCLLLAYVMYSCRKSFKTQIFGLTGLVFGLVFMYFQSDILYSRINESFSGVQAFFLKDQSASTLFIHHTSSGQRVLLGMIDIHLIKGSPFFGFGDHSPLPPFEELLLLIPMLSREVYDIKVLAGSHSEILAQLVRQGLIFGGLTLWGLFFYPCYLFLWKYRASTFAAKSPLTAALGIIIPILASSLTIQVFNLKMTISFYGLCLAIFLAYLCRHVEENTANASI
jgi:hypothetical protein